MAALIGGGLWTVTATALVTQPVLPDWLEEVVGCPQVERVDGVLVVGGDEHDLGTFGEPGQHAGEIQAGQPWHADVKEHDVEGFGVEHE